MQTLRAPLPDPLPLFPLRMVLLPGALLGLKIFEARYLDLVSQCMRSGQPFGVICLSQGIETGESSQREHVHVETVAISFDGAVPDLPAGKEPGNEYHRTSAAHAHGRKGGRRVRDFGC